MTILNTFINYNEQKKSHIFLNLKNLKHELKKITEKEATSPKDKDTIKQKCIQKQVLETNLRGENGNLIYNVD